LPTVSGESTSGAAGASTEADGRTEAVAPPTDVPSQAAADVSPQATSDVPLQARSEMPPQPAHGRHARTDSETR
jgi:hypothetical protein